MPSTRKSTKEPGPKMATKVSLPTEAEVRATDLERDDSDPKAGVADSTSNASAEDLREDMIRREAYAIFERRGGEPGHEDEDWLEAERSIAADSRDRK
jgi:hypothetical protein